MTSMAIALAFGVSTSPAADWPKWGKNAENSMISDEDLPAEFEAGEFKSGTEEVDMATTKNLKFAIKLGSQTYGTTTVGGGKIMVGTNNEVPRDPKHQGDRGIAMCFDEKTGKFLWQLVSPKLGAGKVNDWEYLGICSSPTIIGDVCFIVTNRCEIVACDMNGMADGNQGFQKEGAYMAEPGAEPMEPGPTDADILWVYDMREELGVFPHNVASSSVLHVDGKLYCTTSNGVDWSHLNIPAPESPSLICLDAKTGELLGEDNSGCSQRILHCSWASPAFGTVKIKKGDVTIEREQIIFGGGDGWCYAFAPDAKTEKIDGEDYEILPNFWQVDCNPPEYRKDKDGNKIKYATFDGPSEIVASPVLYDGKVYTVIGQDPEHGEGIGMFSCHDAATGKALWTFKDIERAMSTPVVHDGLVYVADYRGRVFCLDALTGEKYWMHDTKSHIWSSVLLNRGKLYVGNEDGEVVILQTGKTLKPVETVEFPGQVFASPIAANDTLYIATMGHLYAFAKTKK